MTDVKDVVLYVSKDNNEFRFYPTGKCFINGISNHYDSRYPDDIKNIVYIKYMYILVVSERI